MAIDDIIQDLGREMGLPLRLSPDRSCRIIIEDRHAIDIDAPAERPGLVFLHTEIGAVPQHDDRGLLRKLLSANLFGWETNGATLAINDNAGQIIAQRILPTDGLTRSSLEAALTDLIETAMHWQERISRAAQEQAMTGQVDMYEASTMIRI